MPFVLKIILLGIPNPRGNIELKSSVPKNVLK